MLADHLPGFLADEGGPNPLSDAGFEVVRNSPAPGMEGLYRWLQSEPSTPVVGGGLDGIAGFNHPGREPGRFGQFGHLTGVHIEDIVGGVRGKHYHRIPGEGDIDFRTVFDALDDIGYGGFATLELYTYPDEPDMAAREAYEALSAYC